MQHIMFTEQNNDNKNITLAFYLTIKHIGFDLTSRFTHSQLSMR